MGTIASYDDLCTQVANWLNRDDLVAMVPTFVQFAETEINNLLRDRRMEKLATATLSTQYSLVPTDWLETISFSLTSTNQRIDLLPREQMLQYRENTGNTAGRPQYYAHVAGQFEFLPTPDTNYTAELLYYAKLPTLSASVQTNWLLAYAPAVYLYGALVASAPFLKDDDRVPLWRKMFDDLIQQMNDATQAARFSGTGLRMAIRGMDV